MRCNVSDIIAHWQPEQLLEYCKENDLADLSVVDSYAIVQQFSKCPIVGFVVEDVSLEGEEEGEKEGEEEGEHFACHTVCVLSDECKVGVLAEMLARYDGSIALKFESDCACEQLAHFDVDEFYEEFDQVMLLILQTVGA